MDKRHRNILKHHRPYLLENLQPIKLLPYLSSILDESDRQEVKQEPTTEQQVDKLLDIISRKGPDAFGEFMNALERKQMFIALYLKQETEMEKIKTKLIRARADSARMIENVLITRQELEKERETYKRTLKELEALKKQEKKINAAENMEPRLQELKGTITRLEQEVRNEKRHKEIFKEETTRLRNVCHHLNEKYKALQEENQLAKQLSDVNNKNTRKDLARVTEERKELKKQCENLEKQLKEAKANMERQLTANQFQDRVTSPVGPKECEIKDESCSRCEKLAGKLNLITTERDLMREQKQHLVTEVLKLNNRIKEISEDNQREIPTLHKELQILKEERENLFREPEEANAQKRNEMKVLQGKNEEGKAPIKRQTSDVLTITEELMKEKRHFEKSQEDWEQTKKNLTCEKEAESEAKLDAKKQINKSKCELEKQDTHTSEGIPSLGETNNAGRPRSNALTKEVQRPRNMSRRAPKNERNLDKHGVPDLCFRNNFRSHDSGKP
ncbi:polyamine-modulated factor 1-binding protein 1-like isoform X2 [Montipora foliosa]|uniref:polyamine-modulated factor 1-binding protein 1-like isoform X2 n=1 Tax=Montipora foliosa TaxID=591990 RepID=UPI0035F1530E